MLIFCLLLGILCPLIFVIVNQFLNREFALVLNCGLD